MRLRGERHLDLATYKPIPEDEDGLTPRQLQERRAAVRRVSLLRYDAEMNRRYAEAVLALPIADIMLQLEIDEERAGDLKELARRWLERLEMAGAKGG